MNVSTALLDSFVPQGWSLARDSIAIMQLGIMVITIGFTLRRMLEDY